MNLKPLTTMSFLVVYLPDGYRLSLMAVLSAVSTGDKKCTRLDEVMTDCVAAFTHYSKAWNFKLRIHDIG
jgi:hypothetical protein